MRCAPCGQSASGDGLGETPEDTIDGFRWHWVATRGTACQRGGILRGEVGPVFRGHEPTVPVPSSHAPRAAFRVHPAWARKSRHQPEAGKTGSSATESEDAGKQRHDRRE